VIVTSFDHIIVMIVCPTIEINFSISEELWKYNVDYQTFGWSSNYCSNNFGLINFPSCFVYFPFLKVGKLSSLNLLKLSFLIASFTHPNFEFFTSYNSYVYTTKYNNNKSPINIWIENFENFPPILQRPKNIFNYHLPRIHIIVICFLMM